MGGPLRNGLFLKKFELKNSFSVSNPMASSKEAKGFEANEFRINLDAFALWML